MSSRFGAVFVRCAFGPINYAGACIIATRFDEGLAELSRDNLYGGVQRGIVTVAQQAGVPIQAVEEYLPMQRLKSLATRLDRAHKEALAAWSKHTSHGLLTGVADLTVDARATDVGLCVHRLAEKMAHDEPLARPLRTLGDELGLWKQVLTECRVRLDEGEMLAAAAFRRRLRRISLLSLLIGLSVASLIVVLFVERSRSRIQAGLTGDACAAETIEARDLRWASSSQEVELAAARQACRVEREELATALRLAEEEEARRKQEIERIEENKRKCQRLADHVSEGNLTGDDRTFAGDRAPFLTRIAARALAPTDLGPAEPVFPCSEENPDAHASIARSYGLALAEDPELWSKAPLPSKRVVTLLSAHKTRLSSYYVNLLGERAEDQASEALTSGRKEQLVAALGPCALAAALRDVHTSACTAVSELQQSPPEPTSTEPTAP